MLQIWQPNTLPLPYAMPVVQVAGPVAEEPSAAPPPLPEVMVDVNDNFPKGRVVRFFPYQGYGYISDRTGKEVYFNLAELELVGEKGKGDMAVGSPVGYDVSWTSHGLHVKKLKVY